MFGNDQADKRLNGALFPGLGRKAWRSVRQAFQIHYTQV